MNPLDEVERLQAELERITAERDAAVQHAQWLERDKGQLERDKGQLERDKGQLERDKGQLEQAKDLLQRKLSKLEHSYQELCKRLYGRSSEKIDPRQLQLAFDEEHALAAAEAAAVPAPPHADEAPDGETTDRRPRKKGHGRRPKPKDLPRERIVYEPDPAELTCSCCGGTKRSIGSDEVTERYDYRPASLVIVEHVRPRYRCTMCQGGTTVAPLPPAPIDRGLAEPGLLAYVVASKFSDHLPLNRQRQILARHGGHFPRSTLCDWVDKVAGLLEPIADQLKKDVLSRHVVGMDETGIRIVFDKKDKFSGTRKGKIWVYRGLTGETLYQISATNRHDDPDGPGVVLRDYHGFLQADAAPIFNVLFKSGKRIEVGCNAHARRKFVATKHSAPEIAAFVLRAYQQIYKIEGRVRDGPATERLKARQLEIKPILETLDNYLDELQPTLVPGTPIATAVNYSVNHRTALRRFLDDPQLSPDNNAVERALRIVAVGRKNWLFAGSEQAARNAAILYSLVGSCRDLQIEPWAYLRDVIQRVSTLPHSRLPELTPRRWRQAQLDRLRSEPASAH